MLPPSGAKTRAFLLWAAASCAALVVAGCMQASTRGHEAPDTVAIGNPPMWNNGIATLLDLKCAGCHQQPLPDIAPNTTPTDLDLRYQNAVGPMRGGEDVAAFIQIGLQDGGVINGQMFGPPAMTFITPLADSEKSALLAWTLSVPEQTAGGATTAAAGHTLYTHYCQGCHGVQAQGNQFGPDIAGQSASQLQNAMGQLPMSAWPGLPPLATDPTFSNVLPAVALYLQSP